MGARKRNRGKKGEKKKKGPGKSGYWGGGPFMSEARLPGKKKPKQKKGDQGQ